MQVGKALAALLLVEVLSQTPGEAGVLEEIERVVGVGAQDHRRMDRVRHDVGESGRRE